MGISELFERMRANPKNVSFVDALKVACFYFGEPRIRGSHYFFPMPWSGNPLVNLQKDGNQAKPYQIRQLIAAIDRLEGGENGSSR